MTYKEAYKALDRLCDEDEASWTSATFEAVKMAMEVLKKEVPMKPMGQEFDIWGSPVYPCGNCGETIDEMWGYCPWCGQAIDWIEGKIKDDEGNF